MCYNAPVSLITYAIGMLGAARLYRVGYRVESVLYAWVIQMQLIEFFLWRYQPCSDTRQLPGNLLWTAIGILVNHMEPVVLWWSLQLFAPTDDRNSKDDVDEKSNTRPSDVKLSHRQRLHWSIHALFGVFCAASLQYTWLAFQWLQCTEVTPDSAPHLNWIWNELDGNYEYYALFLVTLNVLSVYGLRHGVMHGVMVTGSYLWSLYVYQGHHAIGAMWCFAAAFLPWILPTAYTVGDRLWLFCKRYFPAVLEPAESVRQLLYTYSGQRLSAGAGKSD